MISDVELRQDLKFLSGQRRWVYREIVGQDKAEVLSPNLVPKDSGIYWIAGESTLAKGRKLDSVFRIDTHSGGSLLTVYWLIDAQWFQHEDPEVLSALQLRREEVFPFDWRYYVQLEEDIFHPT